MPSRSPASKRPKPRPVRRRQSEVRGRAKRRIAVGACTSVAIVAARQERQGLGRGRRRLMRQLQLDAHGRAERPAPARELLRRLAVHRVERRKLDPALRLRRGDDRLREGAPGREAAVAEAQHGERRGGGRVEPRQPVEEALGRGRRIAVAIGRGQDQDAPRPGVAGGIEGRHRGGMDRLAGLRQRLDAASRQSPRCCRPRCRRG